MLHRVVLLLLPRAAVGPLLAALAALAPLLPVPVPPPRNPSPTHTAARAARPRQVHALPRSTRRIPAGRRRAPGARVSRALRGEARSLCRRPCAGMQKGALSACVLTATAASERGAGVDSKRARPRSKWGQAAPGAGSTNAQPLVVRAGQHVPSMRSALPLARESLPEGVAS